MLSVRRKKDNGIKKLNLIPILDAVFIFIFFLLTAAQFVKYYNIQTEAPIVSEIEQDSKDKPLNLILEMDTKTIKLKTGIPEKVIATYERGPIPQKDMYGFDFEALEKRLIDLKTKNPKEKSAILRPTGQVIYKDLVELMDVVRGSKLGAEKAILLNEKKILITSLFPQIIYE